LADVDDEQAWFERLAARRLAPDTLLRLGVRFALRRRLRSLDLAGGSNGVQRLPGGPVAVETEAANRQHYEVPTDFFRLVLGPRLKYSSALWPGDDLTLAQAEDAMLELTARRAQLAGGQRVLDLGSGWGSFSLWAAERYPSASFTALSNSHTQREFVAAQAAELGLANVQVVAGNAARLELSDRYDRIVSIEMLEHVRNHGLLLAQLCNALEPDGRIFVHVFSHRRHAYTFEPTDGWMARWFFSGGTMPNLKLFDECAPAIRTVNRHVVNGRHYARTLRAWLRNLDRRRSTVRELFRSAYGDGEADLWIARWRLFFIACEELFAYRGGREWVVAHHLLEPARPA
jgi:cyclopropane-fatty-acyl-phospholipid synthase